MSKSDMGKLVETSHADDRKIIRLVKERQLLYSRNNMPVASFYTQVKKLWQEVASEMNWTVSEVRRKWSHIRNSYSRHLRNEMHSVRTAKGRFVSRWYLADELDFLKKHMATDTRAAFNHSRREEVESVETADMSEIPGYPHLTPWLAMAAQPVPRLSTDTNDESTSSFNSDENTPYFQFFRGIYNDYQELPAKKQRLFKRRCLNFLHDLLDGEDLPQQSETELNGSESDPINMVRVQMADAIKIPVVPGNINILDDQLVIIKEERDEAVLPHD